MKRKLEEKKKEASADVAPVTSTTTPASEAEDAGEKPPKVPKSLNNPEEKSTPAFALPGHLSELEEAFSTIDKVMSTVSFKTQIPLSKIQDGAASIRGINVTERHLLQIKRLWPESFILKRSTGPSYMSGDDRNSKNRIFIYPYNCNYAIPNTLKKRADEFHQYATDYAKAFFTEHNITEENWDKSTNSIPAVEPVPLIEIPIKGLIANKNKDDANDNSKVKVGVKMGFDTKLIMTTPPSHSSTAPQTPGGDKYGIKGVDMEVLQKINSIERQRSEALELRKSVQKEDILGNLPQVIIALRQVYFSDRKNVAPLDDAAQRLSKFLVPPVSQAGAESRLQFLAEVAPELIMITKPPPPPPIFDLSGAGSPRRKPQEGGVWVRWCKALPQNTTEIFNRILSTPETSDLYLKYFGSSQPISTDTKKRN